MLTHVDEQKIYKRLVAALTHRQVPLVVKVDIPKQLKALRRKKNPGMDNVSTLVLQASEAQIPVYAFSILPVVVKRGDSEYIIKDTVESPYAYNPPYGILPQLATLQPDELRKLANHFSRLKFEYQERGDYYHAWIFGWRQRLIERVLNNVMKLSVVME